MLYSRNSQLNEWRVSRLIFVNKLVVAGRSRAKPTRSMMLPLYDSAIVSGNSSSEDKPRLSLSLFCGAILLCQCFVMILLSRSMLLLYYFYGSFMF